MNRIEVGPDGGPIDQGALHRILRLAGEPKWQQLTELETVRLSATAIIRDADQVARGRLHINARPALADDDEDRPVFILTLTARGAPIGEGFDGVFRFLDLGHDWVVNSFVDITTHDMHSFWGKR